ncbi:Ribosomal RNA large subunit methyltransferase K/L [Paenibacillus solanacearum]|uniref:Ribosomal RNA large subunit methyltransferase K/L n=1 Tax=Paenibacillus solanacearum TaxID=2048548 RepID=A0A916JYP1_9BACL|nr:class I SAM-dependent methyltransferase [Paenibacillus solanacearum]CAG7611200.1 Ribosomal RNA large subunit methyltransferase K/L [Paenibacillus solanacearum]
MFAAQDWKDYELIDTGGGEKLERWGNIVLRRPDPQIIWPLLKETGPWREADAHYHRSSSGGGSWEYKKQIPERWTISYNGLSFHIKPTSFKHTGLFPEQAVNWSWMIDKIHSAGRPIRVLNLFAYTGGASVACASAGAEVCHVDASKGVVTWAKENLQLSGLGERPVRFITDDVFKFVQREQRRGSKYDAIIMDPPSYGRGPNGETWKLETNLFPFVESCMDILTDKPLFFLINSYTTGLSASVLKNILSLSIARKYGGTISCGEIGLPITASKLSLPCGILGRWEA